MRGSLNHLISFLIAIGTPFRLSGCLQVVHWEPARSGEGERGRGGRGENVQPFSRSEGCFRRNRIAIDHIRYSIFDSEVKGRLRIWLDRQIRFLMAIVAPSRPISPIGHIRPINRFPRGTFCVAPWREPSESQQKGNSTLRREARKRLHQAYFEYRISHIYNRYSKQCQTAKRKVGSWNYQLPSPV